MAYDGAVDVLTGKALLGGRICKPYDAVLVCSDI